MRILFTTLLLLLLLCPLAGTSRADERSDCFTACANDKRSSDMYCPPAGGYSDDDHRQCVEKNGVVYNDCVKACSPAPATPEPPPAAPSEPPLAAPAEPPVAADPSPPQPAPTDAGKQE